MNVCILYLQWEVVPAGKHILLKLCVCVLAKDFNFAKYYRNKFLIR